MPGRRANRKFLKMMIRLMTMKIRMTIKTIPMVMTMISSQLKLRTTKIPKSQKILRPKTEVRRARSGKERSSLLRRARTKDGGRESILPRSRQAGQPVSGTIKMELEREPPDFDCIYIDRKYNMTIDISIISSRTSFRASPCYRYAL